MRFWIDGLCNDCGCIVLETGSNKDNYDYMNTCSNPKCKNFKWHHNVDDEFQPYYTHGFNEDSIKEKL